MPKIAVGGTRLDSRLADFRLATKSAENRECSTELSRGSVSVFIDLRPQLREPVDPDSFSLFALARRDTHIQRDGDANGFIQALYSSDFLRALCLLYTLARATALCHAKAGQ